MNIEKRESGFLELINVAVLMNNGTVVFLGTRTGKWFSQSDSSLDKTGLKEPLHGHLH